MKQLIAPPEPDSLQAAPEDQACPRCGRRLTDAAGLGWCTACGYCRSLEEERAKDQLQVAQASSPVAVEASKLVTRTPIWLWVLVLGLMILAGASYGVGRWLPPNSYPRALWTTLQILGGLFSIFVVQFFALFRLAPFDETLSFKDAILSGRLWSTALKRMPGFGAHICLATWGLSLIAFAFLFIGGLNHWLTYLPSNQKNTQNIRR